MKTTMLVICMVLGLSYGLPIEVVKVPKPLKLAYFCMNASSTVSAKPPLVLLHGFLSFKEIWTGVMEFLVQKTSRRACAADLRNHGDSPWSNDTDTATMASDLDLLMETLDTKEIALLGHSLGGKIAVHFALKNPQKVERLIVEDMRPNGLSSGALTGVFDNQHLLNFALRAVPENSTEGEAKASIFKDIKFMMSLFFPDAVLDERLVDHVPIRRSDGKWKWKANMDLVETIKSNIEEYMPESTGLYDKPTLFIYGGKSDYKVGEAKEDILKLFPKTEFVVVPKAGHIVNLFPQYKETVMKFLNDEK